MNQEVTGYIHALKEPWQIELSSALRELILSVIPEAEERIQYKKPHFLKNGKYAVVISASKDAVSFTIFNATGLNFPGDFEGPPERKTLKLRKGQEWNKEQLIGLLSQAAASLDTP
ncbi:DUF1801 domain-containing protein [Paenibacillus tepidiphilus]|uniref:DUF1801 domain-containing protein n=1 Tax=Paenibacillus tepidiphilus TaxID=2608683 RepID=UPI00123A4508|nr:DUF1801 domain-containing protein [Paenibacillus tepidiphilus]